ncbi:hypothetical protein QSV08_15755 [Maribacter sp. BPC-D8]|uniref:hypothetical protein n=1 Tax=Maribacter sp. BPC-D8 TaxID=3053613 RepID=UPI002B48051C|nr:hypothetical protein [Maribacter sp. BPC-D8]WRI28671.1 hypothetical protein QSV08_15755 [Maribacter sp. BPC-D8]
MKKYFYPLRMYLMAVMMNIFPFILLGFIIKPKGEAGMFIILTLIAAVTWLIAYLPYVFLSRIKSRILVLMTFFLPSIFMFGITKIWTHFTAFHFDELIRFLWIPLILNLIVQALFSFGYNKYILRH